MPGDERYEVKEDYLINDREKMLESGWPKMAFIENKLNGDPTNWRAPNLACVEALLRSCGFKIIAQPGHEVYVCEPDPDKPSVNKTWNCSEYLSAIGTDWQHFYEEKVKGHS